MLGHARSGSSSPLGTLGPLAHPLCVSPTLQHMTIKASLANCLGRVTPAARGFVEGKVEHAVAQLTHMWSLVLSLAALAVVRQLEGGRQLGDLDQGGFCRCRLPPAGLLPLDVFCRSVAGSGHCRSGTTSGSLQHRPCSDHARPLPRLCSFL